eukprot:6257869-Pyramimonas_sp.AAC.1
MMMAMMISMMVILPAHDDTVGAAVDDDDSWAYATPPTPWDICGPPFRRAKLPPVVAASH